MTPGAFQSSRRSAPIWPWSTVSTLRSASILDIPQTRDQPVYRLPFVSEVPVNYDDSHVVHDPAYIKPSRIARMRCRADALRQDSRTGSNG